MHRKTLNEYVSDAINILNDCIRINKIQKFQFAEILNKAFTESFKGTTYTVSIISNEECNFFWDILGFKTKINISDKNETILIKGISIELNLLYRLESIYEEYIEYKPIFKIFKRKSIKRKEKCSYIKEVDLLGISCNGNGCVEEEIRANILIEKLENIENECNYICNEAKRVFKNGHTVSDLKRIDIDKLIGFTKEYNRIVDKLLEE